jgi:hypothetical protein
MENIVIFHDLQTAVPRFSGSPDSMDSSAGVDDESIKSGDPENLGMAVGVGESRVYLLLNAR